MKYPFSRTCQRVKPTTKSKKPLGYLPVNSTANWEISQTTLTARLNTQRTIRCGTSRSILGKKNRIEDKANSLDDLSG